jgi:hypothetical protein
VIPVCADEHLEHLPFDRGLGVAAPGPLHVRSLKRAAHFHFMSGWR